MPKSEILRSLDPRAFDKSKVSHNLDLTANLEALNTQFSTRSPEEIEELVVGKPRFEMIPYQVHFSTAEDPCLILEQGASFCSLLVAIDEHSNVVSVHYPIVDEDEKDVRRLLTKVGFISELEKKIKDKRVFFITGTGVGVTQKQQQELLTNLEKILGQPVNYFFLEEAGVNQELEPSLFRFLSRLRAIVRNVFTGQSLANDRLFMIGDIFVVPSYISKTGKTELTISHDPKSREKGQRQHDLLISLVDNFKEKFDYNEKRVT